MRTKPWGGYKVPIAIVSNNTIGIWLYDIFGFFSKSNQNCFCIISVFVTAQPTQTSLRRLQDVLKRSRRLTTKQDVFMTSGRRRRIYDVLKTPNLRRLESVKFTTSWRRLIYNVFRTSGLWCPEDVWLRHLEDAQFATSWKRLIYDVFRTSDLGHLEEIFK